MTLTQKNGTVNILTTVDPTATPTAMPTVVLTVTPTTVSEETPTIPRQQLLIQPKQQLPQLQAAGQVLVDSTEELFALEVDAYIDR
jgi:FAD synthase